MAEREDRLGMASMKNVDLKIVLPGPKDSSCLETDYSKEVRDWCCRGELEYVRDTEGHYGTRCKKCEHVRQFQDNTTECCPFCSADFKGWDIPQESWHLYGARCGSRKIGIYSRELDRTIGYRCPDCKTDWQYVNGKPKGTKL